MTRFGFLLLVAGGILITLSFQDRSLDEKASATPEEMTLESLIKRGPEGNPHVAIKDFMLGENGVKLVEEGKPDHFKTIWLPAVPRDPAQAPGAPAPPPRESSGNR